MKKLLALIALAFASAVCGYGQAVTEPLTVIHAAPSGACQLPTNNFKVDAGANQGIYQCINGNWQFLGNNITWPTTGQLVVANGNTPTGVAPVNGECLIGSGGAWVAGSCSGSGSTVSSVAGDGVLFTSTVQTGAVVLAPVNVPTGSGAIVLATSPTLVTPTLGAATATSIDKVTITAPATSATLTIANGATLQQTGAFILNLTATAASTPTFPTGSGVLPYVGAANTWALAQTFSAAPIFSTLTGVLFGNGASATTVATSAQLVTAVGNASSSVAGVAKCDGTTITCTGGVFTAVGAGAVSITSSTGDLTVSPSPLTGTGTIDLNLGSANTWTGLQTFSTHISIGGVTAAGATGTGNIVFATSPTLTTPALGTPASGVITNLTGTCTTCVANAAVNISTNGTANQVWGMNSGASAQGWQTVSVLPTLPTTPNGVAEIPTSTPSGGVGGAVTWSLFGTVPRPVTTTSDTILATDRSGYVSYSNASAIAVILPTPTALSSSNFTFKVKNIGAGTVTITPTTATIDGSSTLAVSEGQNCSIMTDNTNWFSTCSSGQLIAGSNITLTPSASGVTIASTGSSGLSGMTAGQVPIAATASTITSSEALAGAGAGITTGPVSGVTTLDVTEFTGTGGQIADSGVLIANLVTAASNAGAANQVWVAGGANKTATAIDFPMIYDVPAANCNNTTAGAGWSIGSGGTVTCRAGTNNKGGYVTITDTSTTFAQFNVHLPKDWDTGTNPYIEVDLSSTDTTSGHTIIPSIQVSCPTAVNGTTSDDATFAAAHSLTTITIGASAVANGFYTTNVQMNSTDTTGCVAGGMMIVQIGRATDTATSANFYSATLTVPRKITVQAN